jgi:hypothetical protein
MICPICNEYEMVAIWYGNPGIEEIMLAREDRLVLGGATVKEYTHYCHYCQETYPIIEVPYND